MMKSMLLSAAALLMTCSCVAEEKNEVQFPAHNVIVTAGDKTVETRVAAAPYTFNADACSIAVKDVQGEKAPYVRRLITVTAPKESPVHIDRVYLFKDQKMPGMSISGYTDGSVLYDTNSFLGIEHPMAKVSLTSPLSTVWTPHDFKKAEQTLVLPSAVNGGELHTRFDYTSGPDRIDIEALCVLDEKGNVVAEDRHEGFAGIAREKNVYTVTIPTGDRPHTLKFIYKKLDRTNSNGTISIVTEKGDNFVNAYLPINRDLQPGESVTLSAVCGRYAPGQLRRDFQTYLELERAHPYRVLPHYNSWYDICIFCYGNDDPLKRMTEEKVLESLNIFKRELLEKRGVGLNSFLLDDGWDDWNSLWDYHAGFPHQFKNIDKVARSMGGRVSAWLSPWGGYNKAHDMRVKHARESGLETTASGLSLSKPKYYAAFRDRCIQMITDYDMNLFKFDGIGAGPMATGAPESSAGDLAGLLNLTRELRNVKKDVFINCTVGTWASPFWMMYADCIWRGGSDIGYAGQGPHRERWITYRDQVIYDRFASRAPLYPLNSLMNHGVIVSPYSNMKIDPNSSKDLESFKHELWMGIACGTGLQEYYVSPKLMTDAAWDELARAIKWIVKNQNILRDAHFFGDAPVSGAIYGYASWSPEKSIIVVRNSSEKELPLNLDLPAILEIPAKYGKKVKKVTGVYPENQNALPEKLAPFGVVLIEVEFE